MSNNSSLNQIRQWAVYAVAIMALWLFGGGGMAIGGESQAVPRTAAMATLKQAISLSGLPGEEISYSSYLWSVCPMISMGSSLGATISMGESVPITGHDPFKYETSYTYWYTIPLDAVPGTLSDTISAMDSCGATNGNLAQVTITVIAYTYMLTVAIDGTGTGIVSGSGNYAAGTTVNLTAMADAGSIFAGWSPNPCADTFTMPANNLACTATFTAVAPTTYTVQVEQKGTGKGTISGGGNYAAGATVNLTAIADAGSIFAGWSPSPCAATFAMPARNLTCTATFNGDSTPPTTVNAVEFYNAGKDHYFNTANAGDIAYLEANSQSGWVKTGYTFQVYSLNAAPSGTVAVARYYGAQQPDGVYKPDSHFYTALDGERELLNDGYKKTCPQGQGSCTGEAWFYEKDEYRVFLPSNGTCPTGTYPVYRFYNNGYPAKDSNHRYTADIGAAAEMSAKGWQDEGVKMCAQTPGAPPACTYAVSQTSINFPADGGPSQVNVSTNSGCSWTAKSNYTWITITGGSGETGPGTVAFTVSANSSGAARSGTLTIANQPVNISQATGGGGCNGCGGQ